MQSANRSVERRQMTVMFCDLVGSTELSTKLDPEDFQDVIRCFMRYCSHRIEQETGYIARYAGDSVLAYFGYPLVREDDAERAVKAALAIRDDRFELLTPSGVPLATRTGIATGLVVVGEIIGSGTSEERMAIGETANLAARLQTTAAPNAVIVSNATQKLASGVFRFRELGRPLLKGLTLTESVWEACSKNEIVDRFQGRRREFKIPHVGRESELTRILDLWQQSTQGGGRIVGISGEAGIGKSRLLHEVRERISGTEHFWLEGGCAAIYSNTPLHPISQMIRKQIGIEEASSSAFVVARLENFLHRFEVVSEDALPLVAEFVGIAMPDIQSPLTLSATDRRRRLIAIVTQLILNMATKLPTTVALEDLHWSDPSTQEFLGHLARKMDSASLFLATTSRDEASHSWRIGLHHERIVLNRLTSEHCGQIVGAIANGTLPNATIELGADRAGGVPLFAEELAWLFLQKTPRDAGSNIPETLSDLLMSKLDQLGTAKYFAQAAAVLGQEFQSGLFTNLVSLSEADARMAFSALIDAGILVSQDEETQTFAFRHSLIRDIAYSSLLKGQRRGLHVRSANVIIERFQEMARLQPEIVAQHWTAALEFEHAVQAWREAAYAAIRKNAYAEAQQAYEKAIDAIDQLIDSLEHDEQELEIWSAYADILKITNGYSAPATRKAISNAKWLAKRGGDLVKQCSHVAGAWMAASSAGNYLLAEKLVSQLIPLAHAEGAMEQLGVAYALQMTTQHRTGNFLGAEETYNLAHSYFVSPEFLQCPGAAGQTFGNGAMNAWFLGAEEEARKRIVYCVDASRKTGSAYELAFSLYMSAVQLILMNEDQHAKEKANQAMQISDENGFPQFSAISRVALGRAEAAIGNPVSGIAHIEDGFARMGTNGSKNGITMYLTWLAEAHALNGDTKGALSSLNNALEANPSERFYRPESLRLRSENLARSGDMEGARSDCLTAISLAKNMEAKIFHKRATTLLNSLGRN